MNAVDLQQFGEMVQAVKNNSQAVRDLKGHLEKHADKIEEGFDRVHKRIDDHMEQEEEERKELIGLIKKSDTRVGKLEWRLGLIAGALGIGGSAVGPFISNLVASTFLQEAADSVVAFFQ